MKDKIFECIVGSVAYNTNLPTSDIDIKGVYCQPNPDILGLKYQEQRNIDKDTTFYEIRRFIDLAGSANPTILEMLFSDASMIQYCHPSFQPVIDARFSFLTTICSKSFGGFAVAQIKKAKGLDKKMNWEKERVERKDVLDFCTVFDYGKGVPMKDWLNFGHTSKTINGFNQEYIGLSKVNNMPNCYAIYHDSAGQYDGIPTLEYKGVVGEDSNDVRLSSIPKGEYCFGVMHFNKDAYSIACKEYRDYKEWLKTRNESRYVDTQVHGQQVDGKNLLHCVRLIVPLKSLKREI